MRILFSILASLFFTGMSAQPTLTGLFKYSSEGIADSLKEKANAVYRLHEGVLQITSPSSYTYKVHQVITLLNKKAAGYFRQVLYFDKQEKIEDINITVYNALGLKHISYKKSDFETRSYDDRMSVFTDDKMLYLEAVGPAYPCTIEIRYEKKVSGYINLPTWLIAAPNVAVEKSVFKVTVPAQLDIRHKITGIDLKPVASTEGEAKTYVWETSNIKAPEEPEVNSYETGAEYPAIFIAPNRFVYDGFAGNMQTWKNYGDWNFPLYDDKKNFDKAQIATIQNLVIDCKTNEKKVKVLYDHLKTSMRYVSVQLGIGGFKPFPLQYVQEKQYGDCKALTNYMRYMLKAVGISSYPALVNAGSRNARMDKDFPMQYFNHVILCVPMAKDSIWLECTSNNNEVGSLGNFTENKTALLLTEEGGKLVSTPESRSESNILITKSTIYVDEEGGSNVRSQLYCRGDFWDLFYRIRQQNSEDKKNIFTNHLHYKLADKFALEQKTDSAGFASFDLGLSYGQSYDFKTGSKYFFTQRINKIFDEKVSKEKRTREYVFDFPYQKTDTTVYVLPAGMATDQLPAAKEINNEYVHYKSEVIKQPANSVMIVTRLEVKKKMVPPADYDKLVEAFSEVYKNEGQKLVVKKI